MNILVLKLLLAPLIIGSASMAGKKYGPAISGWIVGMPLTSGPVIFFVTLDHGALFAENSILGVLSGGISLVLYALTYAWVATRFPWYISIFASILVFAGSTFLLQTLYIPLWLVVPVVVAAILAGLALMPKGDVEPGRTQPNRRDVPSRILIGTSFILLITGIAPFIGARLTGLLTTIPLYVSILSIFAQHGQGPAAAAHVLRGLLYGMFAFTGFFLVLSILLENAGTGLSFLLATFTALATQGLSLFILQRKS